MPYNKPIEDRIWGRISISDPDSCWLWNGARNDKGYGNIGYCGLNYGTHKLVAYFVWDIDPFEVGTEIRHTCNNPPCNNPFHLLKGDRKSNVDDMMKAGRQYSRFRNVTHCIYGHEYTDSNTYWSTGRNGVAQRKCRECTLTRHK